MNAFVQQLHHRKVGRAFGLYLIAATVCVVLAGWLFPKLNLPDWTLPALLIALLALLPVVLGYAWHFNFTDRKLTRTFVSGLPGPASALPVILAGIILSTTTGVFTVPQAHNFMAKAKLPSEAEVTTAVQDAIGKVKNYPGGAQSIPGRAKLRDRPEDGEISLMLDSYSEENIRVDLEVYVQQFQPKHRIKPSEYRSQKTVGNLIKLVLDKLKPDVSV